MAFVLSIMDLTLGALPRLNLDIPSVTVMSNPSHPAPEP